MFARKSFSQQTFSSVALAEVSSRATCSLPVTLTMR